MQLRGRRLKFTAVLAFVVLALTGFTGHGTGKSRSRGHSTSHSSGGGCSSSSQDHDGSSSSRHYDDDDDYGGSSGGSSSSAVSTSSRTEDGTADGTARLVSCATVKAPYATVQLTNPNATVSTFDVHIAFKSADGAVVDETYEEVTVRASGTKTVRMAVANPKRNAPRIDECDLDSVAPYHA